MMKMVMQQSYQQNLQYMMPPMMPTYYPGMGQQLPQSMRVPPGGMPMQQNFFRPGQEDQYAERSASPEINNQSPY